jgi:hypothetical protein
LTVLAQSLEACALRSSRSPWERRLGATIGQFAPTRSVVRDSAAQMAKLSAQTLGREGSTTYTARNSRGSGIGQDPEPHATRRAPSLPPRERDDLKQAEEASFVDLIACERDCRSCSYAAALDCDGNCGVCPHNSYCPCVNPVVARSKSALRLIELRPILLQDLRVAKN